MLLSPPHRCRAQHEPQNETPFIGEADESGIFKRKILGENLSSEEIKYKLRLVFCLIRCGSIVRYSSQSEIVKCDFNERLSLIDREMKLNASNERQNATTRAQRAHSPMEKREKKPNARERERGIKNHVYAYLIMGSLSRHTPFTTAADRLRTTTTTTSTTSSLLSLALCSLVISQLYESEPTSSHFTANALYSLFIHSSPSSPSSSSSNGTRGSQTLISSSSKKWDYGANEWKKRS